MTELELILRKVEIQKQWLWMLTNLPDEELQLPKGVTKDKAIDEALDTLKELLLIVQKLQQ